MRAAAVALLLLWATPGSAQDARYALAGDQLPVAVTANGYVQTVTSTDDGTVMVEVSVTSAPIGSNGSYGDVAAETTAGLPPGFELPGRLRASLTADLSAWEAATRVLEWAARHVVVDSEDVEPQDAISVLGRGRGRCSGVANATAALLLAAGFEATTISGLLITDDRAVPHRWVACRLPGAGWVHTDPTLGLWTMTPHHVAFSATVDRTLEVRVLDRPPDRIAQMPRRAGRPVRPNQGTELLCRVVREGGGAAAVAVLTGLGGDTHRLVLEPEGRFTALLPGRWRLVVTADGRVVEDRALVLRAGQTHSYTVTLPPASVRGEVGS